MKTLSTDRLDVTASPPAPGRRTTRGTRFAVGGIALACLVLGLGAVLRSNATFAEDYVAGSCPSSGSASRPPRRWRRKSGRARPRN